MEPPEVLGEGNHPARPSHGTEHFHHVDVRGVVGDHWADEIHPNRTAAKRIAERFHTPLKAKFPGLL